MPNIQESHAVLSKAIFGDESEYHDRTRPTLEADGRVHMDPEDGQVVAMASVRSLVQTVGAVESDGDLAEMMQAFGRPETYFRLFDFSLYVTEARLIWEQTKPVTPGEKMVGHLRFPWISSIEFRPKQSFLNDALLRFEFHQEFPVAAQGGWFHTVELGFEKSFNPGPIAHAVAQLAARHHLVHGCPEEVRQALEALATGPAVADPPKGDTAAYYLPIYADFPGGVDYIGDGTVGGEWHPQT